jgi:cytoskeletal protein RodZ
VATAKKPSTTKDLPKNFFQTTPLKLAILSLCTFGFYEVYWFFEMLRRVDPESNKYGRAAKSLFGWIFLYELLTKLKVQRAALLAFVYFVACLTVRTPGAFWTISLLSFIPLAYIQAQLNKRLPQPVKAPYSRTAIAVIVIGGMIVLFSVIGFWTQNNNQPQDNNSVGYQNTSHKTKVSQDQPAQNTTTEQQSTDTSATDASATPSTSSSTRSTTKAATPSSTIASTTPSNTTNSSTKSSGATTPTTPTAPIVNPNATFSAEFTNGYKDQDTGHLVEPFVVTHEAGHTAALSATAYASSIDTVCQVTMNGDSGALQMWFTAPLSPGFYVCEVNITDGKVIRNLELPIDAYQ